MGCGAAGVTAAFGIQEGHVYSEAVHEVFPGTLRNRGGWLRPNETPGWGIDLDERAAADHPADILRPRRMGRRLRDLSGGLLPP